MKPTRAVSALPALLLAVLVAADDPAGANLSFEDEVLPILEEQCFRCHGGRKRVKGGLRLTSREGVLAGGDSGPAVDLLQPETSLLLKMVRYADPDHQMPPKGKLDDDEIELLARWVAEGIPWEGEDDHGVAPDDGDESAIEPWRYGPVVRPALPAVRDEAWVRNPIDAFVLARLEAASAPPAPPADPATLLRRVTFDLTGLPPTPDEVRAFVADPSDAAYEAAIERLLASPRYGERWARHWLDVVRYAETNGFERDTDKPFVWRYRDWVIDAFDEDKPYDRFVREQLAGDELDQVTPETLVATGFQRLMQWDDEPGQGVLQARYDTLDDLVSTTSQAFLGVTLGCARCHDHKKDPIPQADYYRFMAFFHGLTDLRADGPLVEIPTPEERAEIDRRRAERDAELSAWLAARREEVEARGVRLLRPSDDRTTWTGTLDVPADGTARFGLRGGGERARLTVGGVSLLGPGVAREQSIVLAAGTVEVRLDDVDPNAPPPALWWRPGRPPAWRHTFDDPGPDWTSPSFDDSTWAVGAPGFGTAGTPGSEIGTEWSTRGVWLRRSFVWNAAERDALTFVGHHDDDLEVFVNGVLAVEREGYVTAYGALPPGDAARAAVRQGENLLAVRCAQDFGGQFVHVEPARVDALAAAAPADVAFGRRPLTLAATIGDAGPAREAFEAIRRRAIEVPRALAVTERGGRPEPLHVHVRGSAHALGDPVEPAFPALFDPPPAVVPDPPADAPTSGRRRVLAEWIASEDHPMTARVMANRIWQHHLGRGIVRTPNDFGALGAGSTHPALLDWLAAEFVARGWSVKAMHRLILTSATYRMSSHAHPDALAADPANDLFSRFALRRLSAEEMRDTMIAMTGRLNERRGGPSFYSRMPKEALATSSRPDAAWGTSPEEETFRRSIYIKVKRSLLTPFLAALDLADTDQTCPERFTTTQPTQALTMVNGEFVHEMAARFAERLRGEVGDDVDRQIRRAIALALGREATDGEVASHRAFVRELSGEDGVDPLALFCLVVLNLNEFAYVA
ncbi:MAG: DUF1553 domain-containing protein [Planctomycetota bacterium JB042]